MTVLQSVSQDSYPIEKSNTYEKDKKSSGSKSAENLPYFAEICRKCPELEHVIAAWPDLPDYIKTAIQKLAETA